MTGEPAVIGNQAQRRELVLTEGGAFTCTVRRRDGASWSPATRPELRLAGLVWTAATLDGSRAVFTVDKAQVQSAIEAIRASGHDQFRLVSDDLVWARGGVTIDAQPVGT